MEDQIVALVQKKGPIVPSDITRELKMDSLFAGAYLSEMAKKDSLRRFRRNATGAFNESPAHVWVAKLSRTHRNP